jgi:hypothetical protein
MKAKNKTVETENSVAKYVATIKDERRRKDFVTLIDLMSKSTGFEPKMWGTAIVGFGSYEYKYESGREGSAPLAGMSSRANAISLYLSVFDGREKMLETMGKHKTAKGCVYIQKLEDIDTAVLAKIVKEAVKQRKKNHA